MSDKIAAIIESQEAERMKIFYITKKDKDGEEIKDKDGNPIFKSLDLNKISKYLISKFNLIVSDNSITYWYDKDKGIYRPVTGKINIELVGMFGAIATTYIKRELKYLILDTPEIQKTSDEIDEMFTHKHKFCFANGIYDRRTKKLSKHTPKEYFMFQIPVVYDPSAKNSNISSFLSDTFTDWKEEMEWLGYCLTSDNWLERLSFYVGRGNTGTSTWFRIVEKFFTTEFVSNSSIHDLVDDDRSILNLIGKSICMSADIGKEHIRKFHKIKMLVGNDRIPARYLYSEEFTFVNKAKLMYGMNEVPTISDKTDSATRRLRRIFVDNQHGKTPKGYEDRLKTPDALSALLNLALFGLEKLIDRGDFQEKTKINSIELETMAKPIYGFTEELLAKTGNNTQDFIYVDTLFDSYCRWRKNNNLSKVEYNTFAAEFKNKTMRDGIKKRTIIKKGYRKKPVFSGIRFNDNAIIEGFVSRQRADECDTGFEEEITDFDDDPKDCSGEMWMGV